MKYVAFRDVEDKTCYINPEMVFCISHYSPGITTIVSGSTMVNVQGEPSSVERRLRPPK